MINVSITDNKITIKGHSGYAEAGKDIVCSAVSSLFYALAGYLNKRGSLKNYKAESGNAVITFTKDGKEGVLMFTEGVNRIAEAYPEFVSVRHK